MMGIFLLRNGCATHVISSYHKWVRKVSLYASNHGFFVQMGAGGLGSPVLLYLAAAGIGHITIVDADTVDE